MIKGPKNRYLAMKDRDRANTSIVESKQSDVLLGDSADSYENARDVLWAEDVLAQAKDRNLQPSVIRNIEYLISYLKEHSTRGLSTHHRKSIQRYETVCAMLKRKNEVGTGEIPADRLPAVAKKRSLETLRRMSVRDERGKKEGIAELAFHKPGDAMPVPPGRKKMEEDE